jgi:hypothetical protein
MTAVDGAARVPILEAIIRECAYLDLTVTWDEKSLVWGRLDALTNPLLYLRRGKISSWTIACVRFSTMRVNDLRKLAC